MEPIFSREAQVVGWLRNNIIHDESGQPRAFVRGEAVYAVDGRYVGRLAYGFLRDRAGDAVAFMRGASGGPTVPSVRVVPEPPKLWNAHVLPDPRVTVSAATPSLRWSELEWDGFFTAEETPDLPSSAALTENSD